MKKPTVFVVLMENEDGQSLVMGVFDSLEAVDAWKENYLLPEDDEPIVEEHVVETV